VNRTDGRLPSQLRVVGATDLERRLLEASARELPSVELTKRMQKALGISLVAGAAATTAGAASAAGMAKAQAAAAGSATGGFVWPAISIGVLALAVTGAVVGVRSTAGHHAASKPAAAVALPAPAPAPIAAPAAAPAPQPALIERRVAAAPAHHHAAVAATPADLRAEIALVDAARSAVAGGANDRALTLVGRYDTSYPRGTFRPEAAALRIEALAHLGRTAQARALAQKFIAAHGDSPLADRVARVTGLPAR
jgi:hypothetical protein